MPDVHGASVYTEILRDNNILDDASLETSFFRDRKQGREGKGGTQVNDSSSPPPPPIISLSSVLYPFLIPPIF